MKKLVIAVLTTFFLITGCKISDIDPYHCNPGDIDRDGDGRCHESKYK
jgi:hypothetical protein